MKLSRRNRYILKWNGPHCVTNKKRELTDAKRKMGQGDWLQRMSATAYVCRFRGFFPRNAAEHCRLAGVAQNHMPF